MKPIRFMVTTILVPCMTIFHLHAFPLDSVFARGEKCIAVTWTPDSQNCAPSWYIKWGTLCTGSDSVYRHCDFIPGTTYSSIAYSYGGEDSYFVFTDKIKKGFFVGSHLCHYNSFGDPSTAIAGTDCSGFVCYLWNVPRVSTRELVFAPYEPILKTELRPGDILVKPGTHTVLIVDKDDSTHFLIWESTSVVNGCRETIIDVTESKWTSYSAMRNPAIDATSTHDFDKISQTSNIPQYKIRYSTKQQAITFTFSDPFSGTLSLFNIKGISIPGKKVTGNLAAKFTWSTKELPCGPYIVLTQSRQGSLDKTMVLIDN
jgi:hypothetical protein